MATDNPEPEPDFEPISNPTDAEREVAPPSWLTDDDALAAEAPDPEDSDIRITSIGGMFAAIVGLVHHYIAKFTGWDGWELDDEEKKAWSQFGSLMLKGIPIKNLPKYLILAQIAMIELGKFGGWMQMRKSAKAATTQEGNKGAGPIAA